MKQFKRLLLIAIFMLGVVGVTNAQKLGHIDARKLILEMPDTKKVNSELQKIAKTFKDDIDFKKKQLQDKANKYAAEEKAQTPETNAKRQQELQQDYYKIQVAEKTASDELAKKEQELRKPVEEKAYKAIKEVSDEKGLVYVFNISSGSVIIYDKGIDIYNDVKAKLGF